MTYYRDIIEKRRVEEARSSGFAEGLLFGAGWACIIGILAMLFAA